MNYFRALKPDEIDIKVGSVTKTGYTLLLYKNARVDMAILDETVGAENWQRDHKQVKDNLYCGIGINCAVWQDDTITERWVWKWDCGVESAFGDKEKGEASDSFKRAGFNWGIGRELYTSPFIFIECETTSDDGKHYKIKNNKDVKRSNSMRVKEIEYNANREITKLVVVDNEGVQVFPKTKYTEDVTKPLLDANLVVEATNLGIIIGKVAEYYKKTPLTLTNEELAEAIRMKKENLAKSGM